MIQIKNSDMLDMLDMVDSFECCDDFCIVLMLVGCSQGVKFKDKFDHFQGRKLRIIGSVKSVSEVKKVKSSQVMSPPRRFRCLR